MPVKDANGFAAAASADTGSDDSGITPLRSPPTCASAVDVNSSNTEKPTEISAARLIIGRSIDYLWKMPFMLPAIGIPVCGGVPTAPDSEMTPVPAALASLPVPPTTVQP